MDAFIERYQSLVLSVLWLAAGILLFGYVSWYQPLEIMKADLKSARKHVQQELQQAGTERDNLRLSAASKDSPENVDVISSLPQFLFRINSLAQANDVILRKLTVDENDNMRFNIELFVDYFTFIRFTAALESLDVNIHDMAVHPYNSGVTPPVHIISFSITPRNNAQPLEGERLESLLEAVDRKNKRNPFQRFAYDQSAPKVLPEIDLTWVHKLSGIGVDNGIKYATIDRIDYMVNDRVAGKVVQEIMNDRVYLLKKSEDGEQRFILKFRRKKK